MVDKICVTCNELKKHHCKNMCKTCYDRLWMRKKRKSLPKFDYKKLVCPTCSKVFVQKVWNQKFCSTVCLRKDFENKPARKKYRKQWENSDKRKKYNKKYYEKNKDAINKYNSEWKYKKGIQKTRFVEGMVNECGYCGNSFLPTKFVPYKKYCSAPCRNKAVAYRWREKHPEAYAEAYRRYSRSAKGRLNHFKKTARKRELVAADVSFDNFKKVLDRDFLCVYCGVKRADSVDHVVALNAGGFSVFENLVGCCRGCNSSKGDRDVLDWCEGRGFVVPEVVLGCLRLLGGMCLDRYV